MPRAQLWKGVWETFHWNTLKFGFDFISPLQIHHGWGFWHFSKYAFYFGPASKVTHQRKMHGFGEEGQTDLGWNPSSITYQLAGPRKAMGPPSLSLTFHRGRTSPDCREDLRMQALNKGECPPPPLPILLPSPFFSLPFLVDLSRTHTHKPLEHSCILTEDFATQRAGTVGTALRETF